MNKRDEGNKNVKGVFIEGKLRDFHIDLGVTGIARCLLIQ